MLLPPSLHKLFAFCVSGQGYKNRAICVSVCEHSHGWTDWHTVTKFVWWSRSKVKVTRSKNVMSMIFWLQCQYTKCWPLVWHYGVMWCHGMTSGPHGMTSGRHSMMSPVLLLWDRFSMRKVHGNTFLYKFILTVNDYIQLISSHLSEAAHPTKLSLI